MRITRAAGEYELPSGYRRNLDPAPFDDHAAVRGHTAGWTWQPDVYPHAIDLARQQGRTAIIDLGAGSGRRLQPFAQEFAIMCVERREIVEQLGESNPARRMLTGMDWAACDFDSAVSVAELCARLNAMVLDWHNVVAICSDVLEHLVEPEHLAGYLAQIQERGATVVISTPDRVLTRGPDDMGPPANHHHVQEWTLSELTDWLGGLGMKFSNVRWTRSNDHEPDLATCLVVG